MDIYADKTQEHQDRAVANGAFQKKHPSASASSFVDNRAETTAQNKLQVMANQHAARQLAPVNHQDNFTQASGNTTIAQLRIDNSYSYPLQELLNEHSDIISLVAEYNYLEAGLFEENDGNPFAAPRQTDPKARYGIKMQLMDILSELIANFKNVKAHPGYNQAYSIHGERFERLMYETFAERQKLMFEIEETPKTVSYEYIYEQSGYIGLLERIRKDYEIGKESEYVFLEGDAFIEKAIEMGYENIDEIAQGIKVHHGITIGGPALTGKRKSPVGFMHINEGYVQKCVTGGNINNIVQTMFHEYQHVKQHTDVKFLKMDGSSNIALGEVKAYSAEIGRFINLLRDANGDIAAGTLPDEGMAVDAINSYLVYYDHMTPHDQAEYGKNHPLVNAMLFEINMNKLNPFRAIVKIMLPELYDNQEGSGYQMF